MVVRVLDAITDYMCTLCPPLRHVLQLFLEHMWPLLERIYLKLIQYFLTQ